MRRLLAESGSATDFDAWVLPHLPVLRRMASLYAERADRDDLLQDTLRRAWVRRADFDPERGSASGRLCTILVDRARKGWRRSQPRLKWDGSAAPPGILDAEGHRAVDVREAITRLPHRQREAIVLHYYVDLSVSDTARVLRCSPGTVKSQLFDARKRLQKELSNYGG